MGDEKPLLLPPPAPAGHADPAGIIFANKVSEQVPPPPASVHSPDPWLYIEKLVDLKILEAETARKKAESERRRDWSKNWQPWVASLIAILAATGAASQWAHWRDGVKNDLKLEIATERAELQAKLTVLDVNSKRDSDSLKDAVASAKADSVTMKADGAAIKKDADLLKADLVDKSSRATITADALQKLSVALQDTALTATTLVPAASWTKLNLPVGTVLCVQPSVLEGLTGHPAEWWENPTVKKKWDDPPSFWVVYKPGQPYTNSQLSKLPSAPEILARATAVQQSLSSAPSKTVSVVIRINGPLP